MSGAPFRLLLIDDDAYFRDFYSEALKKANFVVDTAKNGEEGMQHIEKQHYDVVIIDLVMPLMSGSAFLDAIKRRKTKRIVLTGLAGETDRSDALKAGADLFLEKSQTTPSDLVKHINTLLGNV